MHTTRRAQRPFALACAALLALAALSGTVLGACTSGEGGLRSTPLGSSAYFDSNRFAYDDGRYTYQSDAGIISKTGVDVSDHQGEIDWRAVANDGISFAMIRVGYRGNTEGHLYKDQCIEANMTAAKKAGLACGVYFYSQALTVDEAREEAAFVLKQLASRKLEYPVVFDYEVSDGNRLSKLDGDVASDCIRTFCDTIRSAGYDTMLYGNGYDLQYFDQTVLDDYPLWYAEYGATPASPQPFAIWQYTESGTVAGISSPTDLNLDLSAAQ